MSIGCLMSAIISASLLPSWINQLGYYGDTQNTRINRHTVPLWYKLIYPKWLTLKHFVEKYQIITKRQYRHIRQERKRLVIGVMIKGNA